MHIVIKVKIDKHNWNKSSSPTLLIEGFVSSTKVQRTARFKYALDITHNLTMPAQFLQNCKTMRAKLRYTN